MDAEKLLSLLRLTDNKSPFKSLEYAEQHNIDHQLIVGAMKSLSVAGGDTFIKSEQQTSKIYQLSAEGQDMAENGSFEYWTVLWVLF